MDPNIPSQPTSPLVPENPTPVPPIQPIPNTPSNKIKYVLLSFLILLILAAVGGGMYYLGTVKQQPVLQTNNNVVTDTITPSAATTSSLTPIPSSSPNTTQMPTPTTDSTTNWNTYSNSKYSYSIKYSPDWSIDVNNQTSEYVTIRSNTTYPQSPGDLEPIWYWINLTYVQNPNNNSFKDLVTKDLPQDLKDNFTYSTEKINTITAYRTTSLPSRSGCEWIYFLKPDNNYISVNFCLYDKNKPFIHQQENYDLFNKMISTFKFTQ